MAGERHSRAVRIEITSAGSVTRLSADGPAPALSDDEIAAYAGRGDAETWRGVSVEPADDEIVIRRKGHAGASWLWDLWLAERVVG